MLGFSSISEIAIADQPGVTLFIDNDNLGTTSTVGSVQAQINITVSESELGSVSATMTVGELASIVGTAVVPLTGISATLSQRNVIVWGEIIPGITTNYSNIATGASQTWSNIATGASQTYSNISAGTPQSWSNIATGASQTWTDIE